MAKSVAIADDHETIVMYLSLIMRRMGYTVEPSRSGEELLEKLAVGQTDLVITDYTMPGMDGLAVIKAIKDDIRFSQIPVLLMSTHNDSEVVNKSLELGSAGFLSKPIQVATLNRLLQQCVVYQDSKRRKNLRCPYNQDVKIWQDGLQQEYHASTLSEGGIFLYTKKPLPVGTRLGIDLDFQKDLPFFVHGTVIYQRGQRDPQSALEPGMAVRFDDLSETAAACIKEYLTALLTEDLSDARFLTADIGCEERSAQFQERLSGLKQAWRGQGNSSLS